jgi:hypothetical protein
MDWWNEFVAWLSSSSARSAIFSAVVLAVAIIVSGLLAAWIARGTVSGMLKRSDRAQKASAIAALVDAATEASAWNSLSPAEQLLSDRAVGQAEIQVRLLPIKGAGVAAGWASHQLDEMKRNSSTSGYQLDPTVAEFRDRLIEWQNRPSRARRIFQGDLERWRYDGDVAATSVTPDSATGSYAEAPVDGASSAPSPQGYATPATEPYTSAGATPQTAATTATETTGTATTRGPETEAHQLIADVEAIHASRGESAPTTAIPASESGEEDELRDESMPPPVPAYGKPTGMENPR